jgi:uncharacterized protein
MDRAQAIDQLKAYAETVRSMGATSLYLYGSTARDEAKADSDLDVFIEYDRASRFNALDLVGIKQFLEDHLGIGIDITTREGLHPRLRDRIERSSIRVF